ncbi:MAG: hypothetical protein JNN30_15235 [Rhodanobacteraceae bacterium]|nr:hypothetical protein [Rhodanobacteraceae bacterium]
MKSPLLAIFLAATAAAPALNAHTGPLDPGFGDGGFGYYGFQPVEGQGNDAALVGCAGPNNTFVVAGMASGGRRIVTVRLLPDGSYDTGFSGDGKESFNLVTHVDGAGACLLQGDLAVAANTADVAGEQNLRLVRVGRDTGLPVSSFGSGGVVDLDLDAHISGLDKAEVPLGLNVLPNGDLAVSGYVSLPGGSTTGFVALLDPAGQVAAATAADCWMLTTVLESPAGDLWAFGSTGQGGCRVTLNRTTLTQSGRITNNMGVTVRPGSARAVRPGTIAMAATADAPFGQRPLLLVFRETAVTALPLPAPVLNGAGVGLSAQLRTQGVQILPGGRVLFGGSLDSTATTAGEYFALARIGRSAADDRTENYFGRGGAASAQFLPDTSACAAAPPPQAIHRMTSWMGRPAFVGKVGTACFVNAGDDYLVGRVETDYLFGDGLD